jgi:RNA polymerase sigma-70 factor (ECF subfamily)
MEPRPDAKDRHEVDVELGRAWREHRRHLLDIAFRMLGNLGEAEDAVQEAFTRLAAADLSTIDDVGGWLVVVVSRLCLDNLRAKQRHPTVADSAVVERAGGAGVDPADRVTLDDSVRLALHVVLERLSPAERTAFVLHDVFQYRFEAIGDIVGRSPAACRQLASRARRTIAAEAGPARFLVESADQHQVTEQFIAACATGDMQGLLAVLDPDVAGVGDLGAGVTRLARGRDAVAPQLLLFLGPDTETTLVSVGVGDQPAVLVLQDRRPVAVVTLGVRDGLVHDIHALVDPAKVAPIADLLGAAGGGG